MIIVKLQNRKDKIGVVYNNRMWIVYIDEFGIVQLQRAVA